MMMDTLVWLLCVALGAIGAGVVVSLIYQNQLKALETDFNRMTSESEQFKTKNAFLEEQLRLASQNEQDFRQIEATLRQQLGAAKEALAGTQAELTVLKERHQEWVEGLDAQWGEKFELMGKKALETVQKDLEERVNKESQQRQTLFEENLSKTLKPFKEVIAKQEKKVEELGKQTFSLKEQTENLVGAQTRLVSALSNSKGRGDWGELELIRLLEESGLLKDVHYEFQPIQDDTARPDIKIKLPNQHILYVDAKSLMVPLLEMENAMENGGYEAQRKKLMNSLKAEIGKLGRKAYQTKEMNTVDFMVLFVPRESMLRIPLEEDPGLIQEAFRKGVILASPLILMALLKTVAHGWYQAELSQSAQEIQQLGKEIYKQAGLFLDRFNKVGRSLETMTRQYDDAQIALTGRVGMMRKLKKLEDYGCQSGEALPEAFLIEELEVPTVDADRVDVPLLVESAN